MISLSKQIERKKKIMHTAYKIKVMQAFLDKKEIEYKLNTEPSDVVWVPMTFDNPVWDWNTYDYRIKPTPQQYWVRLQSGRHDGTDYVTGVFAFRTKPPHDTSNWILVEEIPQPEDKNTENTETGTQSASPNE